MKIGLISDTRVRRGEEVPIEVKSAFEGVDKILHAGGIQTAEVLDWLEQIAPVTAAGRLDGGQAENPEPFSSEMGGDPRVSATQVMELAGHKIGMVNELWLPRVSDEIMPGVIKAHKFEEGAVSQMVQDYFETTIDIVIFGRTLYALVEEHDGILFVNSGSPSLPRNLNRLGNVALLELSEGKRDANIIELSAFR
jgi:putative phosphoesterase